MSLLIVSPVFALLGFAAWRDVATRTIPNQISVILTAFGLLLRGSEGWQALSVSMAAAAGLFVILLFCHARGAIGGGDVKLLVALALGLPPLGTYQLVVATALVGGVLAGLYLVLPHLLRGPTSAQGCWIGGTALGRVAAVEAWRIRRRGPMPYGVAIAIGGILVHLQAPGG